MRENVRLEESEHCWEFHKCLNETKNQCIVYKLGIEKECWVTNRMKPGNPGIMNGSCVNCQWFKMQTQSTDSSD
ncbi:MAG: hypothetical protein NTY91_00350 [Euryarchaeota archaeon]|nr:hypothetical protein [Euryarchaeota archaeon]